MILKFRKILFMLILVPALFSYSQDKIELKNADKLTGKTENGQNIREATGNVHFIHGNVKAYCNSAIQFLDQNKVELRGDVKIFQDTLSLFTSKATYFGNESMAICENNVILKDPKATVKANGCVYYFNEAKAIFSGNVVVTNPKYTITSGKLTYFRNTEDSYAKENVVVTTDSAVIKAEFIDFFKSIGKTFAVEKVSIVSDSSVITSDTLTNYDFEKKSIASGNVMINNLRNNTFVYGNYLENYETKKYTFIKGNSKLFQVEKDTSKKSEKDTLIIYSNIMESYRTFPDKYIATDSVEVIRGSFLSKSGVAVFSKTFTDSIENISLYRNPIVWQDNMQLTGDSVFAVLKNRKIETIYSVRVETLPGSKNSFMIVTNKDSLYQSRFDQIKGKNIYIHFLNNKVKFVDVKKSANSIYFLYENYLPNGVNISEGDDMLIRFDDYQKVRTVRMEKDAKGQYFPENLLNTTSLTLPGFILRSDKPRKR